MSSEETAICVSNVSKRYLLFAKPEDRLKQMVVPRLERLIGRAPRRYYRDFVALNNITFEVSRGETVGVVGRNGSGKSTLLQVICGTLHPTNGSIKVNGRIAALLELGAGFNPEFTGRENVYLNAAILGLSRPEIDRRFDDIARFADIGMFIDQRVKTYSSGMYVRLAFATAINVDPDILIVDEALAVGDEAFQRKCFGRIEEIKAKGGTILFVSHSAQTIVQLCTRALLMDGGELILDGQPRFVVSQYQRLANASPAAAQEIRTAIRALPLSSPEPPAEGSVEEAAVNTHSGTRSMPPAVLPKINAAIADYYDPSLKSQSTTYLEERGARIRNARVTNLQGDHINVLQMGKRYLFEYYVDFTVEATNVGFGMWLRTQKGLDLAGAQTIQSPTHQTRFVPRGCTAHVKFEFSCLVLPSTYFLTSGVLGTVSGSRIPLHRIVDAIAIRVAAEPEIISVGNFEIGAVPSISLNM